MARRAPKRVYTKVKTKFPDKTIIFRGKRYYFYRSASLGKDLKKLVSRLHKDGYKVRLISRRFIPVVDVYTNPEIVYVPHGKILRYG